MIILKIIGVLLLIILAVILLLLALMCIPVCVGVTYDETVSLVIKYLFIRFEYSFDKTKQTQAMAAKKPSRFGLLWRKIRRGFGKLKKALSCLRRRLKKGWLMLKRRIKAAINSKKPTNKKKSTPSRTSKTKSKDKNLFMSLVEERGFWGTIEFFADIGRMLGGAMVRIFRGVSANRFTLHAQISGEEPADTAIKYGKICCFAFPALSYILSNMKRYSQDIIITPNFDGESDRIYFDGMFVIFPIAVLGHVLAAGFRFLFKQIKLSIKNS